jgi:serine/threonine protein kinase
VHQKRLVHRDIAARNFLVTNDRRVMLSDFGLAAKQHDDDIEASDEFPVPIRWAAPEVLQQNRFSFATDMYSFGATLYEIFSNGDDPLKDHKQEVLKHMIAFCFVCFCFVLFVFFYLLLLLSNE